MEWAPYDTTHSLSLENGHLLHEDMKAEQAHAAMPGQLSHLCAPCPQGAPSQGLLARTLSSHGFTAESFLPQTPMLSHPERLGGGVRNSPWVLL